MSTTKTSKPRPGTEPFNFRLARLFEQSLIAWRGNAPRRHRKRFAS